MLFLFLSSFAGPPDPGGEARDFRLPEDLAPSPDGGKTLGEPEILALAERAKNGDEDAFAQIVSQFERFVYNVACRILVSSGQTQDLAEDVAQDVLLKLVEVFRNGTVTSRMVFKEGLKSAFQYATPFGNANMGINTRRITRNMDGSGGSVEIDYVVDMEHVVASRNRFEITVRELGQ